VTRELTWLGHASFRIDTPGGKRVYVDPWLVENPSCPETEKTPVRVDLIAVTHGHSDHLGDSVALGIRFGCPVVAPLEVHTWLARQGLEQDYYTSGNIGGTLEAAGVKVTFTAATHSSNTDDLEYLGAAAGLVIELEDGFKVYFAGDTGVFADMQLIGRLYAPDVAVLPIGDRYTMGPREAALALELLGTKRCVPCHWGTYDLLTGTPSDLRALVTGVDIVDIKPGGTTAL
jgi:L-ascorbate metabolism protein UlaG (beta-lactamase superfamily)